ncbi:hypothetical protein DB42_EV00330 [Neochlamydia sp. EPS4]|nr:hypothetical protein DB42_EV00330 [Neochlamydia sp. EPS4]
MGEPGVKSHAHKILLVSIFYPSLHHIFIRNSLHVLRGKRNPTTNLTGLAGCPIFSTNSLSNSSSSCFHSISLDSWIRG